jgi:hypothetical protein
MVLSALENRPGVERLRASIARIKAPVYTALSVEYMTAPLPELMRGSAFGRNRLGRGLCRIGLRRRAIPSAGRARHIDGVIGLGFGREGLDRKLGRRQ